MLIVGIALKNIPYNFGQFGRLECGNGTVLDTVNDLDDLDEHSSWKRSVPDEDEEDIILLRQRRSSNVLLVSNITHVKINITDEDLNQCNPRYVAKG